MSGSNQDPINPIYSQHDDPQMLMAIAISKQINIYVFSKLIQQGSEESSENSVKVLSISELFFSFQTDCIKHENQAFIFACQQVFLNRFIKKNQKNKTLSEVSINRFNILLYQVKSITLTVEDLVTLMEVIEIYSNNFENLAQYEELWPNLKISFSNILQFIKIGFDHIIQSEISENSQQIKRFIESVLIVFKKIFKIQKDSFLEYATVEQVISKIERSSLCEKLAQQKSEDTSYDYAILVEDQSFSNRVIDLSDELIFAEDANAQKVQRVFRRFLSPNSEFIKEYTNLIVKLVKESLLSEYNQQLIILLSELISNKKVGNASIIKNLSDRILPEVIQNPTCENFDIIILLMKGTIINEQVGREQRLEFFYNLIVGLGSVSIEKTDTKFEQLLQKINIIFKVYSENMKLQNLEKGNSEFRFLENLFEVSYQFMSNMKKIQEAELHQNQIKKMEQINSQEKKMEVEQQDPVIPPPPVLNLSSSSQSKNNHSQQLKPLNSDQFLEDFGVDDKSESDYQNINQIQNISNYTYTMENMVMRIQSAIKKETSQKQSEDTNKSVSQKKQNQSETCEDILQKQFELIAKLSSFLFTIYKAISDVEFLNKKMSTGLSYEILSKLILQINQFYIHYKQISSQLTKIILLFINSNTHFTDEFVKSYCSSLSHFLLRYKVEKSNNQINNHVISIYVKIYLSLTSQKKDKFKEDIEQVNKNILDFFIEGLFEVKNYHMLLLNLIYLNLNTPAEKEKMIKSILTNITVMNQNILILILLLYNLLVSSSYNIFENKFKNILMNLLQQKTITLSQNSEDSNQQPGLSSTLNQGSLSNQNSYSLQNQSSESQGMIDMCDPLNINNFLQISNQNVKKLKLPSLSGQSTTSIIASNISLQISSDNKSNLIQLIKKLNQNIQQVLQNVNNLQVFYSLMIELNQIAQLMDPAFQKSLLITNFEQIQQINAIKNYEGAITFFNETVALDGINSTRDSQIFALLLRTNHLIRSNESSAQGSIQGNKKNQNSSNNDKMEVEQQAGSENSNKQPSNPQEISNKMFIEDDAQEIHVIHLALTNAINRLKLYQKDSQEKLNQVILSIMNETQQIERDIMMCILKQDNLKTSDIFDKLNLSEAIYIDVLKFILLHCNTSIDTEVDKIIDHLKKNLNAVYITELLSIISQPLKYLDKDMSSRFTQSHSKLQQDLNQYVFSRMYVKELLQFIDVLFNYITKNISGKLKDFYKFEKYPTSKQLCEEVLILSVLNGNVSGKQSIETIDTLFNSQVQKFTQYFKSSISQTIQEYERLAFLLILNKFQKYSLQVELFNVIMKSPSISDFSMSVLNQIILFILSEIKQSPLNLKAFCIAFNLNTIPKDSVDANLLRLCLELRKNLDLHNLQVSESNNILLDILLRYPNRQADLLLPFIGQKGVNLKEKLWFPISDLIKTCFQSSNVDSLYDLDSDYDYNNKIKSKAKMEKALSNLKKESARGNYKDQKIIQAIEKMNPEQFIKFDSQVQKFSYEMDKNLYYNTENIANFKTLRTAFTQNFLQYFNTILTLNRPLIQQFIRDCEISPSKITISESEEKNKVMKICFAELMSFFESIIREGRNFDNQFVKNVLILASEIIYTITNETYRIQNLDIGIIGYNTERIIQVSHFIFTNSINSIEIKDHQELIKELFNYSLFLDKLDNLKYKKYFIDILLLLILHIKQAEQEQVIQEKKKRAQSDQQIKDAQAQQLLQKSQQALSNDKMEAEQTREQIIEDLDKKFNTLPKEVTQNICTLEKYQGRHEQQVFYKCHTCNIAEQSYVICSWCAVVCHNGHDVMYYRQSSGTCDCVEKGPQGGCKVKLYNKNSGLPSSSQQQQSQKGYKFERYDFNKSQYEALLSQIDNQDIPPELLTYYLKGKEKEEKLRVLQDDRSQFTFEKKIGSFNPFGQIQDEQDDQYEEVNEEQFIEEEEKNDEEIFSSESDKEMDLKLSEKNIEAFVGSQRTYMIDKQQPKGSKERVDYAYNLRFGDLNKFNNTIQRFVNSNNQFEVESINLSPENSNLAQQYPEMNNLNQGEDSLVSGNTDNQKSQVNNFSFKDISDMDTFLLNLIEAQQKQSPQFNMINAIMQLCEQQLNSIVSNWESISSNRELQKSNNVVQTIDFLSNIVAGTILTSQMDNTLGKIVCRLYKNGLLDMRVREDQFSDNQYFLMQSGYAAQPVAPMIIRKPIDYNNENLIVLTSGSKVLIIDKQKLLMRLAENIKLQLASNNEDQFQGSKSLQLSQTDISIIHQYPLDFTIMHVRFSPKNPQVIAICGLNQIQIWKINNEGKIVKSISIQQKNYGEYINKILWLPNSEQYLMVMNLKSIRLYQVNFEGNSPLIMKFNANDQSGIFKDFIIAENPARQNEFIVLVACADGRVYYQEFGTQQREDIIFTSYISIPSEFVPKGQVCMGISYSPHSNIMTLSYKNGVNIFGKLDIKTHKLANCFTYRPLQSQNKNGLLQFIERSGEIMTNSNEIHVDDNQCLYITALRDPNNQSNYSIHSGYLTVVKLSPNSIVTQPLATNLVKINDDKKCEGYCVIKSDKLDGVKLVMSVHEDGTLNLFGVQNDGQSIHNIHKYIKEQLIADPKDKNAKKNGDANGDDEDSSLKYLSDEDQDDLSGNKKLAQNHPFAHDPTYKILKNEFQLSDLSKNPTLLVDFMEKYQPLRQEADIKLEINKTKNEVVLNNEKNNVLISKSEPLEINMKCQNKQYIIVGIRIRMQMPPNTGLGIYKIKLFNREIKLLNASQDDRKIIDLSLSNLESIYSYVQNNLTFTITSQNPISNSMKISTHDIRLISIEPYGATISQYQLKEKIEQLKTSLKIKALSDKQESKQEDKENPKEVESILINTQKILPVDFQKRRNHLLLNIDQSEVRDLVNELDMLTIQILLSSQQLVQKGQTENFLNGNRLKELANKLKVMLVNPKINGQVNSYLLSSVKRTLKCVLSAYQIYTADKLIVSHPMEYTTFKTLARAEYFYNLLNDDLSTLNNIFVFLQRLEKLAFNKLPLLFMIFSIYPTLLQSIIKKFLQIVKGDYDQKICETTINSILKVIILYFQYLKNKAAAPLSSVLSLEEVLKSESIKDAGKEAFEIFDQFLQGLLSTNLRQKLLIPTREFQNFLKSESQIFKDEYQKGQIRKFDFAFDLFTYLPKLKTTQKEDKLIIDQKEENKKLNQASRLNAYRQYDDNFMEDISEQQDIDIYGFNGDMDIQNVNEANNFLYAGIDNMNEEEMMKLAIEMSLQEKNNNQANQDESESHSKADESQSNSKRMEEENLHNASGEDSESIRIRSVAENEYSEERKSMHEEQNEIIKNKDMVDENEQNDQDIVKIVPQKVSILTFDIASDFLKSMLDKLINCSKQPIGNEILLAYLFLITQTLKINCCQTPQIAYQLVHTFYQIISMVNSNTLSNQNSEEAKVMIISLKILSDVIKTPTASSDHKSKEQINQQAASSDAPNPSSVSVSALGTSEASKQKEKDQLKKAQKQMFEAYKNLREEFKKQFKIYEEKNKVSFVEKIYENFKLMLKHFESNRSSLKIEYANGEVVQVVSKVNLKPSTSEILYQSFKNLEDFNQKLPMLMQIVDQIQFGNLMGLLFYLLLIDKTIMDQKSLQKWSILLSEILVSPTTSQISQPRTQRLLQLLMKTSTNYYDTIDRIGLHKDFETVLRIHNQSKQFKEINYDQLLVIVQSLQKILNIAQERRQNWLKFCNSKQGVIKTLYDAVLNNVKGCVEPSLKLISLYYGQNTDKK